MFKHLVLVLTCCLAAQCQYYGNYNCEDGRDALVHLFEWKWSDITAVCTGNLPGLEGVTLADMGYCGVQVSPPQEHRVSWDNNPAYPWWQRYQPVSYIVTSRSGDEGAFQNMVQTCYDNGIKIIVDAVFNHMTGGGSGTGSAGSFWDGGGDEGQSFPAVPYGTGDFNGRDMCNTPNMEIGDYQNAEEVRNCRLVGLRDLRLASTYVRDMVRGFLNKLISWGVAGFRVDATKHMWPGDMAAVFTGLSNTWDGVAPFIFMEVIDQGGEPITWDQYASMGRVTEFKYSVGIGEVVKKANGQQLSNLNNFGEAWGFMPGVDAAVFTDNHDNQRGHGAGGANIVTYHNSRQYKIANAFMLAWNYGFPRVMSSYAFSTDAPDVGPPHDGNGNTNDVTCFNGDWICEFGWSQIYNMVKFHNAVIGEPVSNWWDNGGNAVSFSRGSKGFIVLNNEDYTLDQSFQTGLPSGEYCDVISCDGNIPPCGGSECRGSISVDGSGFANVFVSNDDNSIAAYHV